MVEKSDGKLSYIIEFKGIEETGSIKLKVNGLRYLCI